MAKTERPGIGQFKGFPPPVGTIKPFTALIVDVLSIASRRGGLGKCRR